MNHDTDTSTVYSEYVDRKSWKYGEPLQRWVSRRVLKECLRVTALNPAEIALLEIGTGVGTLAVVARDAGVADYVGVEPNPDLAQLSRDALGGGGRTVVEAALPNLPVNLHGRFDVAIAVHVIEHATSGYEARAWVEDILRCLKPGGYLLVVSPSINDFKAFFWDIDWSHGFPTSVVNLTQINADLGVDTHFRSLMRLGTVRRFGSSVGYGISLLVPTRLTNALGRGIVGRDLGTGLKAALLWGVCFVVARKP